MGCGVATFFCLIESLGDDFATTDKYCTNWHFLLLSCELCLMQGCCHKFSVLLTVNAHTQVKLRIYWRIASVQSSPVPPAAQEQLLRGLACFESVQRFAVSYWQQGAFVRAGLCSNSVLDRL